MMRWLYRVLPLVVLLSSTLPLLSLAEEATASTTVAVGWQVLPFQSLTVSGTHGSSPSLASHFDLRPPSEADLQLGYIEERGALTLVAASNVRWSVEVRALESDMGRSADGTVAKPLSDFLLRANGGSYSSITTFDQTLAYGELGVHSLVIDYKVKMDRDSYRDGDYSLTLVYTITTEK
jgi:hypothetical protein